MELAGPRADRKHTQSKRNHDSQDQLQSTRQVVGAKSKVSSRLAHLSMAADGDRSEDDDHDQRIARESRLPDPEVRKNQQAHACNLQPGSPGSADTCL
jgi:hypothetical protein